MQGVFLRLLQELHVEIAMIFEPRFVGLGTQRPDQSQAAGRVGKVRTTRVPRVISSLRRSSRFVDWSGASRRSDVETLRREPPEHPRVGRDGSVGPGPVVRWIALLAAASGAPEAWIATRGSSIHVLRSLPGCRRNGCFMALAEAIAARSLEASEEHRP